MRVKNIKFRTPLDQKMTSIVKFYHRTAGFPTLHTVAHDRLDDISTHHKPHFPSRSNVFSTHSHNNMVRSAEERFATERMATRGFGNKKIAAALGVSVSTNAVLAAEAALGWRRGVAQQWATTWCGGWCVRHVFLTCFGVSSVSLVCGSVAVMRSAFVPQRSSTVGFLLTHAAQSPVFAKRLQASGIEAQPPQRP